MNHGFQDQLNCRVYTSLGMTVTTAVFSWAQTRPVLNED